MEISKDIERFLEPQRTSYHTALEEIRNGRKLGHYMWYIFPQLRGLGHSTMAWYYGIEDLQEAQDYLEHPVLGHRLREITEALMNQPESDAMTIFGWPDVLKLHSSLTLFKKASNDESFAAALQRFFGGEEDRVTLELLNKHEDIHSIQPF